MSTTGNPNQPGPHGAQQPLHPQPTTPTQPQPTTPTQPQPTTPTQPQPTTPTQPQPTTPTQPQSEVHSVGLFRHIFDDEDAHRRFTESFGRLVFLLWGTLILVGLLVGLFIFGADRLEISFADSPAWVPILVAVLTQAGVSVAVTTRWNRKQ